MQLVDHNTPRRTITFGHNQPTLEDIVGIAPVTEDRRHDRVHRLLQGRLPGQAWGLYA